MMVMMGGGGGMEGCGGGGRGMFPRGSYGWLKISL